ncbi:MAG: T9SS type A sorting domain-containing protein [Flavobacteriales bacterium]|nr:T9SS type A sorting domain-containing protein [Flavobacteriales bacterium]
MDRTLRVNMDASRSNSFLITDSTGRITWKGSILPGVNELDVSNWSSGTYFLRSTASSAVHAFVVR